VSLDYRFNKSFRLLNIYERLNKGELLFKTALSIEYEVSEKTIQRDFDELRAYLSDKQTLEYGNSLRYDKVRKGYYLSQLNREWFSNEEILVLSKILLESRALSKVELDPLLSKLIDQVAPNDKKVIEDTVRNEWFNYVPLKHNKKLQNLIWSLSQDIVKHQVIEILYKRKDGVLKKHELKPVSIMFSEYYFYLVAYLADDRKEFPTIFRIDRIEEVHALKVKFNIPYKDKFNEGEFRKRVQFMYAGPLRIVTFEYSGQSIESVLDKLPTAEIISIEGDKYVVRAEVFGKGIDMWLRSQGEYVNIVKIEERSV